MLNYSDFTIDTDRFQIKDLKEIYNRSNSGGVHWVPIIDAGIGINYKDAINELNSKNAAIQSSKYNASMRGCVWPGEVNFPDFNHPNVTQFWTDVKFENQKILKIL